MGTGIANGPLAGLLEILVSLDKTVILRLRAYGGKLVVMNIIPRPPRPGEVRAYRRVLKVPNKSRPSLFRRAIPAVFALAFGFATTTAFATTTTTTPSTTTTATTKPAKTPKTAKTKTPAATGQLAAGQKFSTAGAAQATCPADTVVWASFTSTHSFHLANSKYYGKTKHGAYVCEKAATAAGYHQSKT